MIQTEKIQSQERRSNYYRRFFSWLVNAFPAIGSAILLSSCSVKDNPNYYDDTAAVITFQGMKPNLTLDSNINFGPVPTPPTDSFQESKPQPPVETLEIEPETVPHPEAQPTPTGSAQ